MIKKILFLIALVAISVGAFIAYSLAQTNDVAVAKRFEIKKGSGVSTIAKNLYDNKFIGSVNFFKAYSQITGKSSAFKAGEFLIPANANIARVVKELTEGRSTQYSFSIIEGTHIRDLIKQLNQEENLSGQLDKNKLKEISDYIKTDKDYPEGLFLADTYSFEKGADVKQVLLRSYQASQAFLNKEWEGRDKKSPIKTPYEALILASIIEKETAVAGERKKIAGVFVNRLRKGMKLQTDPTVIYGIGEKYDGDIRYKDLRTDTPYNTYTRHGLPPTPIAMPGKAAIHAALHPEKTDAIFFVASGKGGHTFTRTLKEHEAAVQVYLKTLKK